MKSLNIKNKNYEIRHSSYAWGELIIYICN